MPCEICGGATDTRLVDNVLYVDAAGYERRESRGSVVERCAEHIRPSIEMSEVAWEKFERFQRDLRQVHMPSRVRHQESDLVRMWFEELDDRTLREIENVKGAFAEVMDETSEEFRKVLQQLEGT